MILVDHAPLRTGLERRVGGQRVTLTGTFPTDPLRKRASIARISLQSGDRLPGEASGTAWTPQSHDGSLPKASEAMVHESGHQALRSGSGLRPKSGPKAGLDNSGPVIAIFIALIAQRRDRVAAFPVPQPATSAGGWPSDPSDPLLSQIRSHTSERWTGQRNPGLEAQSHAPILDLEYGEFEQSSKRFAPPTTTDSLLFLDRTNMVEAPCS